MNPALELLKPYPFEKLAELKKNINPNGQLKHIALSIGEPKHEPPGFVFDAIKNNFNGLAQYPSTRGMPALRQTLASWIERRFKLNENQLDPETQVLPVNGTREALFSFAQAVIDRKERDPLVVMPNPFYQIYEGAAILAGATPYFVNACERTYFLPDFDNIPTNIWKHCQLLYICSPGNPSGEVIDKSSMQKLIRIAHQYDFIIASDECYSELYREEHRPPPGLLEAANDMGVSDFKNLVAFNSLSKRSNVPGLRSGYIAGDAEIIKKFLLYRTYHGSAMPITTQYASIACWQDENHVLANRDAYREKYKAFIEILNPVIEIHAPPASFYIWLKVPCGDDEKFAAKLFQDQNITVLPGSYLSRKTGQANPGLGYARIALVAPLEECIEAANRIRTYLKRYKE
ncbi:succinyldiaminopimelate transaminase [sulfur-oxidizing endosymbiont of Gigantopelta aegis]|uniref:succinyldiaminopimelate transaminase n=1 Tax=sulfur-oxidizing endosymbiont of Gigantopelta aegis TaxID=2794934 RepID=UPI0018DBD97A|nr:succinyldiaminopimelate transaminase [sulfur-oxidizing endosymbiont of Gigantopelta aegis]